LLTHEHRLILAVALSVNTGFPVIPFNLVYE
jgi:hypothetical protein